MASQILSSTRRIWAGVDGLLARADGPALVVHRLEPLAAHRLRFLGREVPEELVETERASHCPDPALRISRDLDFVVPDPGSAQRALLAAGYLESGDPELYAQAPHRAPACVARPAGVVRKSMHDRDVE
jgi:hypothetical protein